MAVVVAAVVAIVVVAVISFGVIPLYWYLVDQSFECQRHHYLYYCYHHQRIHCCCCCWMIDDDNLYPSCYNNHHHHLKTTKISTKLSFPKKKGNVKRFLDPFLHWYMRIVDEVRVRKMIMILQWFLLVAVVNAVVIVLVKLLWISIVFFAKVVMLVRFFLNFNPQQVGNYVFFNFEKRVFLLLLFNLLDLKWEKGNVHI